MNRILKTIFFGNFFSNTMTLKESDTTEKKNFHGMKSFERFAKSQRFKKI